MSFLFAVPPLGSVQLTAGRFAYVFLGCIGLVGSGLWPTTLPPLKPVTARDHFDALGLGVVSHPRSDARSLGLVAENCVSRLQLTFRPVRSQAFSLAGRVLIRFSGRRYEAM